MLDGNNPNLASVEPKTFCSGYDVAWLGPYSNTFIEFKFHPHASFIYPYDRSVSSQLETYLETISEHIDSIKR
jgi:hypothetical protein